MEKPGEPLYLVRWGAARFCAVAFFCAAATAVYAVESRDLADFSIEELANLQITSASRRSEKLSETPAAAYVISREDILRSGVTSIPEALRLAPGVEVARDDSHGWSISIRGFNASLANKLLVLIDGRSVYSPLFAGVFWDVQDTLLEDVERIEVIAGPGGALWGANAVNGVINIITRSAEDTQGGFAEIGAGNEEKGFAGFRYGGHIGNDVASRAYLKYFDRDASELAATGGDDVDDWRMLRGGFRMDWSPNRSDSLTFQGDAYDGEEGTEVLRSFTLGTLPDGRVEDEETMSGANLLGRWTRDLAAGANLELQIYYDRTERDIPNTYAETRDTLDIDFQHRLKPIGRHDLVWGAGFRVTSDESDNSTAVSFEPADRTDRTFSLFLQDKIGLRDRLFLTLGSKFEHNDYTGFEYQPNARLSWLVSERQTLWGAVSRAVRIPSRLDSDLRIIIPSGTDDMPLYIAVDGSEDFDSEELIAYETGYRIQARNNLSFDLAVFYNDYDNLQGIETGTPEVVAGPPMYIILPNSLDNGLRGKSHGATLMSHWEPMSDWRLRFHYSFIELQLRNKPGSLDASTAESVEGSSPRHQFSVHSFLNLFRDLSFYTGLRYVDNLPAQNVDSYVALDARLGWQLNERVELSVTGQNLTDGSHPESSADNAIERSIYGKISWRF